VDRLFQVIRSLRAKGVGIIYISHRLEEISAVADRVTVLRDGNSIASLEMKDVTRAELIHLMVGREIAAIYPKREVPLGEIVLETRGLNSREAGVQDVTISVRRGEVLGIAGLVGSGRTELAEVLFGIAPADSGEIRVGGNHCTIHTPAEAIARGIGYVPEDRRRHGVVLEMAVAANASLACLNSISRGGMIDAARERDLARNFASRLEIKTSSLYAEAGTLSGGNQQKLALARWLAIAPQVLILDEPTQGVDVGSKSEIHRIIMDLAEQGVGLIMISSELPEILGMSDRIAVMHGGRIAGILPRAQATQQSILSLALGTETAV
jgi:rhamnose transport system ATP-binding protein